MKEKIFSQYPYRIELHSHTNPGSGCSALTPAELVRIYAEKGYHGVVITNHLEPDKLLFGKEKAIAMHIRDYEAAKTAAEQYGIAVYLGVELRFKENINDYLIYGVDKHLLNVLYDYVPTDLKTFRNEVSLVNSVILQAHPFRSNMVLAEPSLLDGMECMNMHPRHNSAVGLATQYAYEKKLQIKIAGGDCHGMGDQGLAALRTKVLPKDSFEIAEILKSGDYVFEIGGGSLWMP